MNELDQYGLMEPENFDLQNWFERRYSCFTQLDQHPRILVPAGLPFVGHPEDVSFSASVCSIKIVGSHLVLTYEFTVDDLVIADSVLESGSFVHANKDPLHGSMSMKVQDSTAVGTLDIAFGTVKHGIGSVHLLKSVKSMLENSSAPDLFYTSVFSKE